MSVQHKRSVIERLRAADQWLAANGREPLQWVRDLLRDAAQELESESGSLWAQWMTGPHSHVRVFVTGEMNLRELDSFMAFLTLQRQFLAEDEAQTHDPPVPVSPEREP